MERYLTGLVALMLFGALAAFLGYIPVVPTIVTVLILTALVLMFFLGLYVGANVDWELLAQADPKQTDTHEHSPARENDAAATVQPAATARKNDAHSPLDSTKRAA